MPPDQRCRYCDELINPLEPHACDPAAMRRRVMALKASLVTVLRQEDPDGNRPRFDFAREVLRKG